jgi:ParB-like chromosome segregation protein Spo0J
MTTAREMRPLSDLRMDDSNPRVHDRRNINVIRNSLTEFGQVEPLVVQQSTSKVVGGNGRLEAMIELGWDDAWIHEIDVDDVTARALSLALNRSGELASWDGEILLQAIEETMGNFELDSIGFIEEEINDIVHSEDENIESIDCESEPDESGPEEETEEVEFKFGDVETTVPAGVYDAFMARVNTLRKRTPILAEIISEILG